MSRRLFLQGTAFGSAAVAGGTLGPWPFSAPPASAALASAALATSGMPAGLGYPGLPEACMFGAELQYFRMSPSHIPARLELCREAHFGVIQAYVPWNVHEFTRGIFDFEGRTIPILPDDHFDEYQEEEPQAEIQAGGLIGRFGLTANTNLVLFMQQVKDMGFKMILRPGPFISDEWRSGGLPDWLLLDGDPSMFVKGPDGSTLGPGFPFSPPLSTATGGSTLFYFSSPSYASQEYLSAARTWLTTFTKFLIDGEWLSTQGGPVVGMQVDDESCFFYRFGPFEVDYNPDMLARWNSYSGGQPAPRAWPPQSAGIESLRPAFLWQRFKAEQIGVYLAALSTDLRDAGFNLPINHELELDLSGPGEFFIDAQNVILDGEYYNGSDPSNIPLNEICAQAIRAASRQQQPTFGVEMNTGDPLLYNVLVGEGIYGGLQFTYTEGLTDGTLGEMEPLGRAFQAAGPMLSGSTRRADVALVWDNTLTWAPFGANRWGFANDVRAVIERHVPALATLLIRGGFAFDFVDVNVAQSEDLTQYPTILLGAADIMPAAFQSQLVEYVANGGRLVCMPTPPRLDSELNPCTVLSAALFPEPVINHDDTDGTLVQIAGTTVPTWLGVDLYQLSGESTVVATLNGSPCGYERPYGRGSAVLLGTWLAADSVPERAGMELETAPIPPEADPVLILTQMATKYLGEATAARIPQQLPGGTPQIAIVYYYANERRGGETIASGCLAYFDGENVVGLAGPNTDINQPPIQIYPYHPILPGHITVVQGLAGVTPHVVVSSDDPTKIQARILDGPDGQGATIVVANRWPDRQKLALSSTVGGQPVRLPLRDGFVLPGGVGLFLPVRWPLPQGRTLVQATAQLLEVLSTPAELALTLLAPSSAEVVLALEAVPNRVTVNGSPSAFWSVTPHADGTFTMVVAVPSGQPDLVLSFP